VFACWLEHWKLSLTYIVAQHHSLRFY